MSRWPVLPPYFARIQIARRCRWMPVFEIAGKGSSRSFPRMECFPLTVAPNAEGNIRNTIAARILMAILPRQRDRRTRNAYWRQVLIFGIVERTSNCSCYFIRLGIAFREPQTQSSSDVVGSIPVRWRVCSESYHARRRLIVSSARMGHCRIDQSPRGAAMAPTKPSGSSRSRKSQQDVASPP
jgi:hypothetical protein